MNEYVVWCDDVYKTVKRITCNFHIYIYTYDDEDIKFSRQNDGERENTQSRSKGYMFIIESRAKNHSKLNNMQFPGRNSSRLDYPCCWYDDDDIKSL